MPCNVSRILLFLLPCLLLLTARLTWGNNLAPGIYLAEGGSGTLTLSRNNDGRLNFTIFTVGTNNHTCDLKGEVKNNRATLHDGDDQDLPCIIRFSSDHVGINVSSTTEEACQPYCGMRADFKGIYLKPAPACLPKAVGKTRAAFKRRYDRKQYTEAVSLLEPLLRTCSRTLPRLEAGWISNDLALAWHKLGQDERCLYYLQVLTANADTSNEQLRERLPPADYEDYLPMIRATRTNLKLCRNGLNQKH